MIKKTACPIDCYDGCSILATVENGQIQRLDGNPEHPITKGALCNRGRRLADRQRSKDRILHPLKKVNGAWVKVSWDQALSEIAREMQQTLDTVGHHGILHAYDWGSGAILKNLNQRFFYQLGGCTETVGSICWEAGLEAQRYDFGQARSHSPYDMALHSQVIVVWGRNVATTNVHMMPFIKSAQARGAKVVVINPTATDLSRRSDLNIYPRSGTDAVLALGVLRVCRNLGYLDDTFIAERSIGFDQLIVELENYSIDKVCEETGVSSDQIFQLAEMYGNSGPVSTLLGLGMQRYRGGGNTIRAIDALVAATGHVGAPGGGVNYAQRGMASYFDEDAITGRSSADTRLFERVTQAEEILAADPPIEVMFVTRTNPMTQIPDTALLQRAYEGIRCKVVIDTFMTKTGEMADYFLPCTNVLEEEDVTYTTMWHPYLSYIQPVVKAPGEAIVDWSIFQQLAERLGIGQKMRGDVTSWLEASLRPLLEAGVTLTELKETGFARVPIEEIPWATNFVTPSGKFEFYSELAMRDGHSPVATYLPPASWGERDRYPFTLLTIHPRKHENSQRDAVSTDVVYPVIEISNHVAEGKGIVEGSYIRVWNDNASLIGIAKVVVQGDTHTVKMESGWWGQGITVNHFTTARKADFGSQSTQYDCACNVELVNSSDMSSAIHA